MSKKFPAMIHVTREDQANDEPYLQIHEDGISAAAEVGEAKPCALYKLVEVGAVVAPPSYVPPKRKRP